MSGEREPDVQGAPAAPSGAREPLTPVFPWFRKDVPRDGYALRCEIDDLRAKQRRGRFTLPTYFAGMLYFIVMGLVTGHWPPTLFMTMLLGAAAWVAWMFRRDRRERIGRMEEALADLPLEGDREEGQAGPAFLRPPPPSGPCSVRPPPRTGPGPAS